MSRFDVSRCAALALLPLLFDAAPSSAAPIVVTVEGQPPGSLSGKTVVMDPGHGIFWHDTYGWIYQRSPLYGLHEDLHTNEIIMDYVRAHLEGAGARVLATRSPSKQEVRVTIDEKDAEYSETGTWTTTANPNLGYKGSYRYAKVSRDGVTATARYTTTLPTRGDYPVWVFYYAAADRSTRARFAITHAGGTTHVTVDQQRDRSRWVYLGTYPFVPSKPAMVTLDNFDPGSPAGSDEVVIADAVRFGVGMSDVVHDGKPSGKARWHDESFYYMLDHGAPETVYKTRSTERDSGLISRALYADWQGADAFVSIHTNAASMPDTASGVTTYIHDSNPSMGSAALQGAIHKELVRTDRTYVSDFRDRGKNTADFAVVRETRTMPATLLELAFHDNQKPDAEMLRDPRYRSDISRAVYKGIARYFDAMSIIAPLPPTLISVESPEGGMVRLLWRAETDPLESGATPQKYRVFIMHGVTGFGDPIEVTGTEYTYKDLQPGEQVFFQVRAVNAGGESLPSNALGVMVSATPDAMNPMMQVDENGAVMPVDEASEATGCRLGPQRAMTERSVNGGLLLLLAAPLLFVLRRRKTRVSN